MSWGLCWDGHPIAFHGSTGVVQSIKDHITKPTAMARGRVAHLIEWKGWSAHQSGWELSPAEDEHYCCLPDELREARFAAGERGFEWVRRGIWERGLQSEGGPGRKCSKSTGCRRVGHSVASSITWDSPERSI